MPKLQIIEIDSTLEAIALRASAEYWGYDVNCAWIGNSQQVVDVLRKDELCDVLLVACHGRDSQILLPELVPDVAKSFPYQDKLGADDVDEFLNLRAEIVIFSGCQTSSPDFSQVFFQRGCQLFVAPSNFPEGDCALKFQLDILYGLRHYEFRSSGHRLDSKTLSRHLEPLFEGPFSFWFNHSLETEL